MAPALKIAAVFLLTLAVALLPASAFAQGRRSTTASPPALRGNIKHWAVSEYPLPRDREQFGGGEEVDFWIEPPDGEGPNAIVGWWVDGSATVYPLVTIKTRVTVEITESDSRFLVQAARYDATTISADEKPAVDLQSWLREQIKALPKGEREPIGDGAPGPRDYPKELRTELYRLDRLRKGRDTPFDQLEDLGGKLLEKFPGPKERGQVYYWMAHVYAQSGLVRPEKVVEHAKKALELPLEPLQAPRLYVYWGDALRVAGAKEPLATRRKHSAVVYLAGLREVMRYPLPAKAPMLPGIERSSRGDKRSAKESESLQRQVAAREFAEFQGVMVQHRDVLVRQIAELYNRPPIADDELRELAAGVLREAWLVDGFQRALKGAPWESIRR